jgi:ADP-heptose:LPS heptosyltransferase
MLTFKDYPKTTWEAVATALLVDGSVVTIHPDVHNACSQEIVDLLNTGIMSPCMADTDISMSYHDAFRNVETQTDSYLDLLASANNLVKPGTVARLCNKPCTAKPTIIVSPYSVSPSLDLPHEIWKHIVKQLRTYDADVLLLDDNGKRLDVAAFMENEILSLIDVAGKKEVLDAASLVIGLPNAWTWLAAEMETSMILLYPDTVPQHRWFWKDYKGLARLVFEKNKLEIPILLTGIRKLIEVL